MNAPSKIRLGFLLAALGSILILCIVTGYQYQQYVSIKKAHRQLIIENDSIMSVNIELKKELEEKCGSLLKAPATISLKDK